MVLQNKVWCVRTDSSLFCTPTDGWRRERDISQVCIMLDISPSKN
ncbi:hypothetical protein POPTR_010G072501v4 [Populus trichocarpa]|uniref:Uncharacterized protein n=1 Tax=Populus trichocarpa TaxID=3694 RepID=A0ACC0SB73_POPTR|nr:hypothetical protein BDE02_10G062900 [Populus trichocarpa]KAI9386761.1 hypothetical protein POPTR_010G072501v4 [Populus trichocarpa]